MVQTDRFPSLMSLPDAAAAYQSIVKLPVPSPFTGNFATAHTGEDYPDAKTLIVVSAGQIAVSAELPNGDPVLDLEIEWAANAPATIVRSGYYDSDGVPDEVVGTYSRAVIRRLTPLESAALVQDMQIAIAHIPEELR